MKRFRRALTLAFGLLLSGAAAAGMDHSPLIKGPLKTGPEVTAQCLQCHEKQAHDFIGCGDCHGPKGRMDWKALGYGTDPRAAAKKR